MQPIIGNFRSRYQIDTPIIFCPSKNRSTKTWAEDDFASVSKIRLSEGYEIKSFRELVDEVANVTLNNTHYEMFYRGQAKDYKDKNNKTIVYPSICRPSKREDGTTKSLIRSNEIIDRYDKLYKLINLYKGKTRHLDEWYISLFQHYETCFTPLIDITQSLRVAATMALRNTTKGYLFVFGLPYPHGSISHFIDQKIVLVKLQNVSPVNAYRPRYQEGYLVGKYPIRETKEGGDNLAKRLVAKCLFKFCFTIML